MNLTISIPLINKAYKLFTPSSVPDRKAEIQVMRSRFGTVIDQSIRVNNVPASLLTGILMIENPDAKPDSINPAVGATGLGQMTPITAFDYLKIADRKRLLSDEKKTILRRELGSQLDVILKTDDTKFQGGSWKQSMTKHLQQAEFNTMMVGLALSLLIAEHDDNGVLRPDYICARYNQGYYLLKNRKISKGLTTDELISKVPAEAKSYILKLVGKNGWMEILT